MTRRTLFRRRVIPTVIGIALALTITGAAFLAGYYSRGQAVVSAQSIERYHLLSQAQDYLNQYYIREQPTQQQLEYGAIRGLITALNDKYTFFVDPPVARSESNVLAGTYGGIGVQLKRDEGSHFVLYPFRDSPAAKAGVQDGDILLTVNGKEVPLTTQQDAVDQLLRGEVKDNHGVTISVRHPGGTEQTFSIPFQVIDIPSVTWRTLIEEPTFGYVQILRFTNRTPDELKTALDELKTKSVKGLILDMRNNPGGLLDESVKVAGAFLNGGVVFIEKTRTEEKVYNAPDSSALTDLPLIVLVNGGTASAAELVAGAIRDRQRGILIGQQTYGKGSVQLILELTDHSSIHVTTAEWLPPSRKKLDGIGLTPDIPMIADSAGRDVELGEAIRQLSTRVNNASQ